MDAMLLSTTRIDDPASGRAYPFLDCRDAVALLNPDAIRTLPVSGEQPLLPPRSGPAVSSQPAPPAVAPRASGEPGDALAAGSVPPRQPRNTRIGETCCGERVCPYGYITGGAA